MTRAEVEAVCLTVEEARQRNQTCFNFELCPGTSLYVLRPIVAEGWVHIQDWASADPRVHGEPVCGQQLSVHSPWPCHHPKGHAGPCRGANRRYLMVRWPEGLAAQLAVRPYEVEP